MTDHELSRLATERDDLNDVLGAYRGPIRALNARDRARCDEASARYRALGAAITRELIRRGRPATVRAAGGAVELHLTADRLHYAQVDPETGEPAQGPPGTRHFLLRYPRDTTAR